MNIAANASAVLVVLILCVTIYSCWARRFKRQEFTEKMTRGDAEATAQRAHERYMVDRGFVQVPFPAKEHLDSVISSEDDDERLNWGQSWQLAWIPKEQVELALTMLGRDTDDAEDVLQEALRTT